jgi:acetyltransferase-like isoleucine patch superfamily enzyme
MGCFFSGRKITVGNNTVINRNCFLDGRIGIEIGNNVGISPTSFIVSLGHDPQASDFATTGGKVVLSDYVWVGIRATILPGVRLGKGCVVGAGAVVTKSFDDFSIIAGVPAQKIGSRTNDLQYDPSYFPFLNTDILPEDRSS